MLTKFTLPKEAEKEPLSKRLWLQSRRTKDGKYMPAGQARKFNYTNLCIAFDALRLIAPRAIAAAAAPENRGGMKLLAEHVLLTLLQAFIPPISMWTFTQMMNYAEAGLSGRPVELRAALWAALALLFVKLVSHLSAAAGERVTNELSAWYELRLQGAYFWLKLGEPLAPAGPGGGAERGALLHEAAVHAGHEYAYDGDGSTRFALSDARYRLRGISSLFRHGLRIASELSVAWVTLGGPGRRSYACAVLFLPLALKMLHGARSNARISRRVARRQAKGARQRELESLSHTLSRIFQGHIEEVQMLDAGAFLLRRWEAACAELHEIKKGQTDHVNHDSHIIDTVVGNAIWVGVATRFLVVDATLGSLMVTNTFLEDINYRLAEIVDQSQNLLNHVFFVLPFIAVADERQEVSNRIDYETTRGNVVTAKPSRAASIAASVRAEEEVETSNDETASNHSKASTEATAVSSAVEAGGEAIKAEDPGSPIDIVTEVTMEETSNDTTTVVDEIKAVPRVDSGMGSLSGDSADDTVVSGMAISLRDVGVTYPDGSEAVRGVTLDIAPGETLAIVGHNGSGKTTLVRAILGLLKASGSIEINGVPRAALDPKTVAARVATVFQETVKHGLTLGEEIGLGALGVWASEGSEGGATLRRAVERGDAAPILRRVALGQPLAAHSREWAQKVFKLDAEVALSRHQRNAREATYLSGGEWQRVALARAFMRADADLLVFDEPTSSLDPKAEARLFESLLGLGRQGCTTIFISHGFGNVRRADRIAFMEKGQIREYGTHEELIRLGGQYKEFYSLQANRFK